LELIEQTMNTGNEPVTESILSQSFLFRFSVPCYGRKGGWSAKGLRIGERYCLPSFSELEGKEGFADLRAAWNRSGLFFSIRVSGKKQLPWCRHTRMEDSDGLHVLLDTRNTQNIHRASRFCHHFVFLPFGAGRRLDEPVATLIDIHRAKEHPRPIAVDQLRVRSEKRVDGYILEAQIRAEALTGFEPDETDRLGFSYLIADRELGSQSLAIGPEFPVLEDPSLWGTLELFADDETDPN
jgi:hypothetical protein